MQNKYKIKFEYINPRTGDLSEFELKVYKYILTSVKLVVIAYNEDNDAFDNALGFERSGIVSDINIEEIE